MKRYKLVCKKGEGTFSEVVKAQNLENGKDYAIKCMKSTFKSLEQVNNLREIQALRKLSPHPNIITLEEVLYDQPSGRLAMVFELMDANLYDLISGRRDHLDGELVRRLSHQMFIALHHMHENGIFHRDIKPENILIDVDGEHLKLADLGSCRSIQSKQPLTEYIATRWYRSPECLLTNGHYGSEMDIFGAGCVLFELIALFPLFPGADEVDQINRIHKVLGTPARDILMKLKAKGSRRINYNFPAMKGIGIKHFIPHASLDCINLIEQTLIYDYEKRIDARGTIEHSYFSALEKPASFTERKKLVKRIQQQKQSSDPENKKKLLKKNARVVENTKLQGNSTKEAETIINKRDKVEKKAEKKENVHLSDDQSSSSMRSNGFRKNANVTKSKVDSLQNIKTNLQKNKTTRKATKKQEKGSTGTKNSMQNTKRFFGRDQNSTKIGGVAGRRNPRLPKFDRKTEVQKNSSKISQKNPPEKSSTETKRKKKYANVASSGYGSTYQVNHVKPMDRTKLRKNGLKAEQTSAGTGKTSNTSLSSNPSRVRLQKNAAAMSRVSEKKFKRKEAKGTRLPIISNA